MACKKWHLGPFTVSVCRLKYIKIQLQHLGLHFFLALAVDIVLGWFSIYGNAGTWVSIFFAFLIEVIDGFRKVNDDGRPAEGFNIYPDLVFRCSGAFLALMVIYALRGIFF